MRQQPHHLELLGPTRDTAIVREVILHGADAVYTSGSGLGARHDASNSLKDIAELVSSAHRCGAKIFVTPNTILHDDELELAQRLTIDLYQTGVDTLIVQDIGVLELDIPPTELHASTQCDIRSVEKAKFLSDVGSTQIMLARELSLEQINAIRQAIDATIELFIHEALCVAYSGQCYVSHIQTGRNANRGDCSQVHRLPYTLKDDQGRVVSYEKHPPSMRDNDQTVNLGALIDAGVRSFKVEGRYKDMSYVENITAHYHQMLDVTIEEHGDLARSSAGRTEHSLIPSAEKTFHRGSTDHFVNVRKGGIGALDSPKFIGLPVGEVPKVAKNHLDAEVTEPLASEDDLNALTKHEVVGFRASTVEKTGNNRYRAWPNEMLAGLHKVRPHHLSNRNLDHSWQQASTGTSSERHVAIDIELDGWQEQLILTFISEEGVNTIHTLGGQLEEANNAERALSNLQDGPAELDQTMYYVRNIRVNLLGVLLAPNGQLNQFRCEAVDMLNAARLQGCQCGSRKLVSQPAPVYPQAHLSFLTNVYNQKVRESYHCYGIQLIDAAYEAYEEKGEVPVMIIKHRLRFAFNLCPKQAEGNTKSWKATSMRLVNGGEVLTLKSDCRPCEVHVVDKTKHHILEIPLPGSVVASVSPEELMKTLLKRRG